MSDRRQLLGHVWLQAVLIALAAIVLNHASSAWFFRVDLTDDKDYTLSPASRAVMAELDKPLVARMYFTPGLEAPYNNHRQAVREKLEELRAFSNGRMELQIVDPSTDELVEEAQRFGVNPIQYRYQSRDRAEMKQVFMGVSLVYGDRQEVVDPITTLATLEYELVRTIHALTTEQKDRKTIGLLQGNGEPDLNQFPPDNPMGQLRDQLGRAYNLQTVVLGGDTGVPDDLDALIVIGPQQPLTDRAQYQLDQYLMKGGSVAMFLSNIKPDFDTMRALEVRHGLFAWLGSRGLQVDRQVVVDRKSNEVMRVPVVTGRRRALVPVNYPLIPVTMQVNHDSPITRGLTRSVVPFASSLTIADPLPDGVEAFPLLTTEDSAAALTTIQTVRPDVIQNAGAGEKAGPFTLAVALHGRFRSFYADRPIPPAPAHPDGSVAQDDPASKIVDGEPARLVVVGSADFVANNLTFVLNSIDWLVQDPALIAIRSRIAGVDALQVPEGSALFRWKAGITLAPLALLWLGGLGVWVASRRRGKAA